MCVRLTPVVVANFQPPCGVSTFPTRKYKGKGASVHELDTSKEFTAEGEAAQAELLDGSNPAHARLAG